MAELYFHDPSAGREVLGLEKREGTSKIPVLPERDMLDLALRHLEGVEGCAGGSQADAKPNEGARGSVIAADEVQTGGRRRGFWQAGKIPKPEPCALPERPKVCAR